ncbi:MAG TPA: hypothetical protein VFY51_09695 [Pyrinomonadaceae bacterium]|nr:hypothetical protein [Pyrinomonadaceae bacterium]
MSKKFVAIGVCLIVVVDVLGQTRSKSAKQRRPVKQPPEVIEAYRVCNQFQQTLAENFDFERAFEATFTKDPARRREVAIAETEHGDGDLSQVDNNTVVGIYKGAAQLLILLLPLMFAGGEDEKAELFPPPFEAMFERKPPNDPKQLPAYADQLKRDIPAFRAHVEKLAERNSSVAKNIQEYKKHLLKPVEPPNRVVKPMTGYSKGRVLRPNEEYYQIDNCAVIREGGQMRLIGYIFLKLRG